MCDAIPLLEDAVRFAQDARAVADGADILIPFPKSLVRSLRLPVSLMIEQDAPGVPEMMGAIDGGDAVLVRLDAAEQWLADHRG